MTATATRYIDNRGGLRWVSDNGDGTWAIVRQGPKWIMLDYYSRDFDTFEAAQTELDRRASRRGWTVPPPDPIFMPANLPNRPNPPTRRFWLVAQWLTSRYVILRDRRWRLR